jgi:hypothetical protein
VAAASSPISTSPPQHVAPVEDFPPDTFAAILTVMVEAPFRLARQLLPGMYDRGYGRIVNISSVHGLRASPYKSAYVAAKHGLEGLSKVLALEGGPHGVTTNCICPAYVRTPLVEAQIADQARIHGIEPDEVIDRIMLTEPAIKRLIEPDEVASLAVRLCTPELSFVTGASLGRNGDEDLACGELIAARLRGDDPDPTAFTSRVATSDAGRSFVPGGPAWASPEDLAMACDVDRFAHALHAEPAADVEAVEVRTRRPSTRGNP